MVGCGPVMRVLGRKAKIEIETLKTLRDKASTVCVTPLFQYVCKPNQMMPNKIRDMALKPFG